MEEKKIENGQPVFEYNRIKVGSKCKVCFYNCMPDKSGEGQFGEWNLWNVFVIDAPILDKDKETGTKTYGKNYIGNAIMFPREEFNKELLETLNGQSDQWVTITKQVSETDSGKLYPEYIVEKIDEPSEDEIDMEKLGSFIEVDPPKTNNRNKTPFGNKSVPGKKTPNSSNPLKKLGSSSNTTELNEHEQKLVDDVLDLVADGYEITKDLVIKASKEPTYGGDISELKAGMLFDKHIKPKMK